MNTAKEIKLHEGYTILPPFDHKGARYDWCDEDEPGLDPLQRHSINCRCADCQWDDDLYE